MTSANAQELSSHQWENRILLIFTENKNNPDFEKQISALKENRKKLEERKLVVYQITSKQFKKDLEENSEWQKNEQLYINKTTDSPFEIQLIGLDGGIKMTERNFTDPQEIFSKIDSMPMRRAEMRDSN
ncbi:DUF4174 domain-containing protein [Antarcticibacterium sp. 1MA-6-2]|uniref:DUF4174 domain-containing protein n=1 Tax=Antarcticibacterium sp. 1MA-6-2 TaxID=2908210 RepID=UPI001F25F0AB|nr:DUF4174 domain-containing protein [Antarcticibacterium sp. 1MA-6-2]UJH90469.1 DUF4174 domain-containing protein [Antarcticibacterium sp. 1MA-6-2]